VSWVRDAVRVGAQPLETRRPVFGLDGLVHVSDVLIGEPVAVEETEAGDWRVRFFDIQSAALIRSTQLLRLPVPVHGDEQAGSAKTCQMSAITSVRSVTDQLTRPGNRLRLQPVWLATNDARCCPTWNPETAAIRVPPPDVTVPGDWSLRVPASRYPEPPS